MLTKPKIIVLFAKIFNSAAQSNNQIIFLTLIGFDAVAMIKRQAKFTQYEMRRDKDGWCELL